MHGHKRPLPNYLYKTLVAQTLGATVNKWYLLKLRSFCKAKDTVNKTKGSLLNGKNSSPTPHQTKDIPPKYIVISKRHCASSS